MRKNGILGFMLDTWGDHLGSGKGGKMYVGNYREENEGRIGREIVTTMRKRRKKLSKERREREGIILKERVGGNLTISDIGP